MLMLVNDLVDLYLIQNDQFVERPMPVNLSTCLLDVFNIVSLQAQEKSIDVDISVEEQVKEEVLVFDDQRITSIVLNLVMNAIKFSPEGGRIRIEACFEAATSMLKLSVADTGIGMSDEVKKSLFTMFRSITRNTSQLDAKNKRGKDNTSGAGLGLTFCRTMIERLGGTISLESEVSKGSTFVIKFPVKVLAYEDLQGEQVREKSIETVLIGKLQRL